MWVLDLKNLEDFSLQPEDQDKNFMWKPVNTSGPSPGAISHHTSVIHNGKLYIYGGNLKDNEAN